MPQAIDGFLAFGVNHRSAGIGLRERLGLDDPAQAAFLRDLAKEHAVTQAVVLSTCDRMEVFAHHPQPDDLIDAVRERLTEAATPECIAPEQWYEARGAEALQHLFAVASSLESRMVGEPHVLGQVKAAHRLARSEALTGSEIEAALQAAYACAKRVRAETAIAEGPVSVASAAVRAARDVHGALDPLSLLLVGSADPGELFVEQFMAAGLGQAVVVGRRRLRIEAMAARLAIGADQMDRLPTLLASADIVISAVGGLGPVIGEEAIRQALKRRRNRPMLLLDLAVPADVEPGVHRLDNAFLFDAADLEVVAERNRGQRETAAAQAWTYVSQAVDGFVSGRQQREAVPVIRALVQRFESERDRAIAESGGDAEKAARLVTGRLLSGPVQHLRQLAQEDADKAQAVEQVVSALFGLGPIGEVASEEDAERLGD